MGKDRIAELERQIADLTELAKTTMGLVYALSNMPEHRDFMLTHISTVIANDHDKQHLLLRHVLEAFRLTDPTRTAAEEEFWERMRRAGNPPA